MTKAALHEMNVAWLVILARNTISITAISVERIFWWDIDKIVTPPERPNKINYRVTFRHRDDLKPDDEIVCRDRRMKFLTPPFDMDGKRIFTAF